MIAGQKMHPKLNLMKTKNLIVAATIVGSAFIVQQASAQFTLFDNFNSDTAGNSLTNAANTSGGLGTGWHAGPDAGAAATVEASGFGSGNYAQENSNQGSNPNMYEAGLGIAGTSTAATVFLQFD